MLNLDRFYKEVRLSVLCDIHAEMVGMNMCFGGYEGCVKALEDAIKKRVKDLG